MKTEVASVLKSSVSQSANGYSGVAGFNLNDLANQASIEVQEAKALAQSIIEEAKSQSEAIRQTAVQAGHEQGLLNANEVIDQRVKVAVDAALQSRLLTLEKSVDELWQKESQWLDQWRENTLKTALEIAKRVTRQEIKDQPEILLAWVNEAMATVRSARRIIIAVHPETLSILGSQLDAIVRRPDLPHETAIEADESVEPMGVIIRQDGGSIDMQLETQFEELATQLES